MMEQIFEQVMAFSLTNGWQLAVIAVIGIVILGILKYKNVFSKIEKEKRKTVYLAISVGISLIATIFYLLIIKQFDINYVVGVTAAIYALNQAMYSVYENTGLREVIAKLFTFLGTKIKK